MAVKAVEAAAAAATAASGPAHAMASGLGRPLTNGFVDMLAIVQRAAPMVNLHYHNL